VFAQLRLALRLLLRSPTLVRRKETVVQKRMWKVITPVDKKNGDKYWMRLGTGFLNKDESINVYLDAIPVPTEKSFMLQLREMTDEDFAPRDKQRAAFELPRSSNPLPATAGAEQSIPF
jgi:hypothetical protein